MFLVSVPVLPLPAKDSTSEFSMPHRTETETTMVEQTEDTLDLPEIPEALTGPAHAKRGKRTSDTADGAGLERRLAALKELK